MSLTLHFPRHLHPAGLPGGGHADHPRTPRLRALHGRWRAYPQSVSSLAETSPHRAVTVLRPPWAAIGAVRRRRALHRAVARSLVWWALLVLVMVIGSLWMAAQWAPPPAAPSVVSPAVPPVAGTLVPAAGPAPAPD